MRWGRKATGLWKQVAGCKVGAGCGRGMGDRVLVCDSIDLYGGAG